MLGHLKGRIEEIRLDHIYIDVNNVGYKVFIPLGQKGHFIKGKTTKLYIFENIKEDRHDLYGFLKLMELELFEKLISVNGVGPKAGMNIMSVSSYKNAISNEDVTFFTAIPGIGKKVASKIILDLKSKITGLEADDVISSSNDAEDLIDALVSLNYNKQDIVRFIPKIPEKITDTQDKIRWLLKNIK